MSNLLLKKKMKVSQAILLKTLEVTFNLLNKLLKELGLKLKIVNILVVFPVSMNLGPNGVQLRILLKIVLSLQLLTLSSSKVR